MSDELENIIIFTDCYKVHHHAQYPPGTQYIYSYFESRGGKFPYTSFFGLQHTIKKWLVGKVVTREKIDAAKALFRSFSDEPIINEDGWNYILEKHNGHLPIRIKAVPEGSVIPTKNVLFTVENTDPNVPWLTGYLETMLVQTWYPVTVATISRIQKQIIFNFLKETTDDDSKSIDSVHIRLHDFGFRGASSHETAAIGAGANLVNFHNADTPVGFAMLRKYYNSNMRINVVPASEHSTITSWGRSKEREAFKKIIERFGKGSPYSVVIDSYDAFKACEEYLCNDLCDLILDNAKSGGVLCVRPDSGDPLVILPQIFDIFAKKFGCTVNSKGFKELPDFLQILQGDGINYQSLYNILQKLKELKWSAKNISFGSGGALLQRMDRDTQKFAYKCSYAVINGEGVNVFKDPVTDHGKKSKKGRLSLHKTDSGYCTVEEGKGDPSTDLLMTIFENGVLLKDWTLDEIRCRSEVKYEDISGIFA